MRHSLMVVIGAVLGLIVEPSSGKSQDTSACSTVLQTPVFNTGTTRSVETFANSFRSGFCKSSWSSESDLENRSRDVGFSFQKALTIIGLNSADASSQDKRTKAQATFCSRTTEDIASSREFFNEFRDSDTAVQAWERCISTLGTRSGHFAISVPAADLTGTQVIIKRVDTVAIPTLAVQSVQTSGKDKVTCEYNGSDVMSAKFPDGQTELSFTCLKAANANIDFSINTNWGNFQGFSIPGYAGRIADLQRELAAVKADLDSTSKILAAIGVTRSAGAGVNNGGFWSRGQNGADMSADCPPGQVVVGVYVRVGGTCNNNCNLDLDGRPFSHFTLQCAPLQLTR